MPFDDPRSRHPDPSAVARGRRAVAAWLFTVCFTLLVMIVLGGVTRLTGSGLSIMEWAPLSGTLPPLSHGEWERLFGLYQRIPQYSLMHEGFGLAGFQRIFWLEWTHRLWGRLAGVVFLLPLIVFALRGMIGRRLGWRLTGLFLLGGLQGAVGWFMVASGFFPDSTAVSPYRLVVHLTLALILYSAILWTGLSVLRPVPTPLPQARGLRRLTHAACGLVALTILAGGFVAGTHAGLAYNTFPLMEGHWVPTEYAAMPLPRGFFENIATVQFDHRLLATLTGLVALAAAASGLRRGLPRAQRLAAAALGAAVLAQYGLGVSTLLHVVPVPLAAAHQAMAVLLLTAALVALHGLRGAKPVRAG